MRESRRASLALWDTGTRTKIQCNWAPSPLSNPPAQFPPIAMSSLWPMPQPASRDVSAQGEWTFPAELDSAILVRKHGMLTRSVSEGGVTAMPLPYASGYQVTSKKKAFGLPRTCCWILCRVRCGKGAITAVNRGGRGPEPRPRVASNVPAGPRTRACRGPLIATVARRSPSNGLEWSKVLVHFEPIFGKSYWPDPQWVCCLAVIGTL